MFSKLKLIFIGFILVLLSSCVTLDIYLDDNKWLPKKGCVSVIYLGNYDIETQKRTVYFMRGQLYPKLTQNSPFAGTVIVDEISKERNSLCGSPLKLDWGIYQIFIDFKKGTFILNGEGFGNEIIINEQRIDL